MDNEHCDPFAWELVTVTKEPEWITDDSGVYVVIYRLHWDGMARHVRLDLMRDNGIPIRSWQGTAESVRKSVMRWLDGCNLDVGPNEISLEHASYIGSELARAAMTVNYVQS